MSDVVARVKKLKEIYDAGLITKEEFDAKRLAIIDGEVLSSSPPPASSPRMTSAARDKQSPRGAASSPSTVSSSPPESASPRSPSRPKFDASMPYDPANVKRSYKEDHQRQQMPQPAKGVVSQRIVLPDALREFTGIKVVQQPENPKVGVYLGPTGGTGGVYASQHDVRKKVTIGAPEVSTKAHIGSAAEKISTVVLHTAGDVSFEERIFANTNVMDLISACVRKLEILHPASYFGLIQKRANGEVWISPDVLASELGAGAQLVVVPKQSTPEDIKKAYFARVLRKPVSYTVETDGPSVDVESMSNEGKQFYKQYDL